MCLQKLVGTGHGTAGKEQEGSLESTEQMSTNELSMDSRAVSSDRHRLVLVVHVSLGLARGRWTALEVVTWKPQDGTGGSDMEAPGGHLGGQHTCLPGGACSRVQSVPWHVF